MKFWKISTLLLIVLHNHAIASGQNVPAIDIECNKTQFFQTFSNVSNTGKKPTLRFEDPISSTLVSIVKKSAEGKRLPAWIRPASNWLVGESLINSKCVRWNNDEWYFRQVFWPHRAPDGFGFIAINLTKNTAFFILGKQENYGEQPLITHAVGDELYVTRKLSEGFVAVPMPSGLPDSCYFSPSAAHCK